ncbi:MAG TPA: hypothetical protein VFZ88_11210 [Sphingomicrobium sp.]
MFYIKRRNDGKGLGAAILPSSISSAARLVWRQDSSWLAGQGSETEMGTLLGNAAVIAALAKLVHKLLVGRAYLTWARRCDPSNPSFRPPHLPGGRTTGDDHLSTGDIFRRSTTGHQPGV